jgi:hypothetical protein
MRIAPNGRSEATLRQDAAALLKGCQQHFKSGVKRVSNISAVVPPARKSYFQTACTGLVTAREYQEFLARLKVILEEFPLSGDFFTWYMHPDRAPMIFASQSTMDPEVAAKLPNDTNPEEAQHNKLYHITGESLDFSQGLYGLWHYSEYWLRVWTGSQGKS